MDEVKRTLKYIIEKMRNIKHIKIYIALAVSLIAVCTYLIYIPKDKKKETPSIDNNFTEISSSAEYVHYLENKLENVITAIKGVGQVDVVITLEKGFEYIYQTEEETKTTSNGTSITTTEVVLVNGKPVIKEEIYPTIKGIIVVAQGGGSVATRMDILSVIQTAIDIDSSQIKIMERD